ncbi:MAG: hypothetical protein EXS09_16150 [Gemmataceae bacterium]|nr:hypothetical protein [Gemmataceae bacterium]
MSDKPQEPPSVFARLRAPATLNYLIMGGAGLLLYAFVMFGQGNDIGAILAICLAVPGVLTRWTGSPILILLLTIYLKIDPSFINIIGQFTGSRWFSREPPGIGFFVDDLILAAGLLAYSIGHFRLLSLIHQSMPEDPTSRRDVDSKNPPRRPMRLVGPDELQKTLMVAGVCVIAAQVAWWTVVFIERAGRPNASDFSKATSRLLIVVWIGGSLLILLSAVLVYLRGNRMTRSEAAIALRDDFFQENRRETDRLQRWRKRFKERVAVRRRSGK